MDDKHTQMVRDFASYIRGLRAHDADGETLVLNRCAPGIEHIQFRGTLGYEDEEIRVSNSSGNGLRIEVTNEDTDWVCFHIQSKATALLIAEKLVEWCERIADPPSLDE